MNITKKDMLCVPTLTRPGHSDAESTARVVKEDQSLWMLTGNIYT